MRYTIGVHIPRPNGKDDDGIYIVDSYGFSGILPLTERKSGSYKYRIPIIDNLETAQAYVKYLSHLYRKRFHNSTCKGCKIEDFKFFLLKFDTLQMQDIVLDEKHYVESPNEKFLGKKEYYFKVKDKTVV